MSRDGDSSGGCFDQIILWALLFYLCYTLGSIDDRLRSVHWEVERISRKVK